MALVTKTKAKPSPHYKKRSGAHHRKSKQYVKTYWPYLPMLFVVGLGIVVNSLWSSHTQVLGASSDYSPTAMLNYTNQQRSSDRESPLTIDASLNHAAAAKAQDMVAKNYWSHISPSGQTPWNFITATGYSYQLAGENLAYGFNDAASTITGWMNSPEHRANILNSQYQNVGFGIASSPNFQGKGPSVVIVAIYAEPVPAAANITFTVAPPSANQQSDVKAPTNLEPASRLISRIQILSAGHATWSMGLISLLMGLAAGIFLVRHGLRLRRLLSRGEAFVSHHPLIDLLIVIVLTCGVILTRTSGVIR